MAVVIRLTYSQTGKTTMVNFDSVETIYRIHDRATGRFGTRVNFPNDRYVIVEETLQEILKMVHQYQQGVYQDTSWVEDDVSFNIENRMEDSYNQNVYNQNPNRMYNNDDKPVRQRRYNNTYHNNRY